MVEQGKKLTASEVAVKTATIEVKVLQIGNRQFTLSVFDQLTEEPIIDPDTGKLRGIAWGRVNRHTDCKEMSKHNAPHLHIIWQKGNELRKAVAAIPWEIEYYEKHPQEIPSVIACTYFRKREDRNTLALLWLKAKALAGERKNFRGLTSIPYNINGHRFDVPVAPLSLHALQSLHQDWAIQQLQNELRSHVGTTNADEILGYLYTDVENFARFVPAWEKSYKQLEKLDQLFIAV